MGNCSSAKTDEVVEVVMTIDPVVATSKVVEDGVTIDKYPVLSTVYVGDIIVEMLSVPNNKRLYRVSHDKKTVVFSSFNVMATSVISEARSIALHNRTLQSIIAIKGESGLHLAHLVLTNVPGSADKEQTDVLYNVMYADVWYV